ncbi:MAG: hypothetical protein U9Q03_00915 [Patescibacteria group bacterium]|nr:hypothetical protein [Patescibacteria group bacterium]
MNITGEDIWQAVENDAFMMSRLPTEAHRAAMRVYVRNWLPAALSNLLDSTASVETVFRAQLAHAHCCEVTGLTHLLTAADMKVQPHHIPEFIKQMTRGLYEYAFSRLKPFVDDVQLFLDLHDATERDVLKTTSLTPENIGRILCGEMTIGDVLLTQPAVVLDQSEDSSPV